MENKKEEIADNLVLKEGSRIYRTIFDKITEVITIERVTKTQAISTNGTYKFKIDVSSNGYVMKIGNTDKSSTVSYYIESPQLKKQLWKQQAIKKLKEIEYSKLHDETIEKLLEIIKIS